MFYIIGQKIFRQVGGTSTGKKHAPSLCCLGAGKLEEEKLFPSEVFRKIVLNDNSSDDESDRFYKRFIDDMISAMEGSEDSAKELVDLLNSLDPGVSFNYEL